MNKIWAKINKGEKIINDYTLTINKFCIDNFYEYMKEICYNLKIETPLILQKHKNQLEEYSMTKFNNDDFIDYITFDSLIIELFEES